MLCDSIYIQDASAPSHLIVAMNFKLLEFLRTPTVESETSPDNPGLLVITRLKLVRVSSFPLKSTSSGDDQVSDNDNGFHHKKESVSEIMGPPWSGRHIHNTTLTQKEQTLNVCLRNHVALPQMATSHFPSVDRNETRLKDSKSMDFDKTQSGWFFGVLSLRFSPYLSTCSHGVKWPSFRSRQQYFFGITDLFPLKTYMDGRCFICSCI